jgi:hypothetical protein
MRLCSSSLTVVSSSLEDCSSSFEVSSSSLVLCSSSLEDCSSSLLVSSSSSVLCRYSLVAISSRSSTWSRWPSAEEVSPGASCDAPGDSLHVTGSWDKISRIRSLASASAMGTTSSLNRRVVPASVPNIWMR